MKKNTIVLTGGGTTGHVSVNLALIPLLKDKGWEIHYIGSKKGIEKNLISEIDYVHYHEISTGKLRRYFSYENLKDIFKVILGTIQATYKIFKIRPNVTFSKGGYVSVPVLVGSWLNRVPSITHESDLTPGLANKLVQPFVKTIFTTFEETEKYIKDGKGTFLGPVIRDSLKNGNAELARQFLKIKSDKPVLLVMGGSLGASFINKTIVENLDILLQKFEIVHSTGEDWFNPSIQREGYHQFKYINAELKDIFALADLVVSRSGANAIFEFLYYRIPMILIPLPTTQSRGDQIDNAKNFERNGYGIMIEEKNANQEVLLDVIEKVFKNKEFYIKNMEKFEFNDTIKIIYDKLIEIKR